MYDDFKVMPKPKKKKKLITLDEELIIELKKRPKINVSNLVNSFLWYYIRREGENGQGDK